jgi:alpha-tubulin suppressor-like RCC1 family protein
MRSYPPVTSAIRPLAVVGLALLVLVPACREDTQSPTPPESAPALATTATAAPAFTQVSAGARETCGVTAENGAYCWGFNEFGEIGDGTTTGRLRPVAVAGGLLFRMISVGTNYACGVTTDYRAYCWGFNGDGLLGDGTTINRASPVPVAGGKRFRLVDAGTEHTCGVSYPDNLGYCWGYNGRGGLGDGTITKRLTPTAVSGGLQFRQVAAGLEHTCGVTTSDRAYCWGSDSVGQVGDSVSAAHRLTPTRVKINRRFRQIDAGAGFSCAVTTTGKAFCWGNGRDGQVGDGKDFLRYWPVAVAGKHAFGRVTTGERHTCGETTDNRTYCWGSGGIGDGTITQHLTPALVAGGHFFSQVSAGGDHTCGRTPAAVAYCWGSNEDGEVGDGTTTLRLKPVRVAGAT